MSAYDHRNCLAREHLLLTVLGKDPKPACYTLEGRQAKAQLAPVALLDLLPEKARPDRVLAICTPEAKRETLPLLERELGDRFSVEAVDVPGGETQEDVNTFLAKVTDAIPERAELTVDVTHGFRHFSFLTYIAVLYLAALRRVRVRGAYYGMLNRDSPSPFLDLRPLLELPSWVHALEVLRETGSALPIAENLRDRASSSGAKEISDRLSWLSEAYLAGLPLELGCEARALLCKLKDLESFLREKSLPLAEKLTDRLDEILQPMVLDGPASGKGWKKKIKLSENELARQVRIIDDLLLRRNFATAIGLMNEWTVSWVVWLRSENGTKNWLDYRRERKAAASLLGAMGKVCTKPDLRNELTDDQRNLGNFWRLLTEIRNAFAHHGMRPQILVGYKEFQAKINRVQSYWQETLRTIPGFSLLLGRVPGDRVLVSPIGLRPGVLFSALKACRAEKDGEEPALCLVICSRETEELIEEALEYAKFSGKLEPLILEDSFGGKNEVKTLAKKTRVHFVGANEVLVNVTGGTTLMGFVAERLANEARSLACPVVRRFGLIDRRPPREQEIDPYQAGEPFWLDPKDNAGRWQS